MFDAAYDLGMVFGSIGFYEFLKVNALVGVHRRAGRAGRAGRVYIMRTVFRPYSNATPPPMFIL